MRAAWVFLHPSTGWDHLLLWNVNKIDVGFVNIRVPRGEKWQLLFIEVWAGWRSQQELAKHLGIATVGSHCHFGGGTGEKQNYWKLKAPQMGGSHPTKSGGGKWAEPEPPLGTKSKYPTLCLLPLSELLLSPPICCFYSTGEGYLGIQSMEVITLLEHRTEPWRGWYGTSTNPTPDFSRNP